VQVDQQHGNFQILKNQVVWILGHRPKGKHLNLNVMVNLQLTVYGFGQYPDIQKEDNGNYQQHTTLAHQMESHLQVLQKCTKLEENTDFWEEKIIKNIRKKLTN
jgi:hypothetical protein